MFRWAFHILFSSWVASAIHSPMEYQTEDASFVDAQEQYVCADNKTWKEKRYNIGCSWFAKQLKNKKPCSHWVALGQFSHCHETCGICAKQKAALVCEDTKGWKDKSGDTCAWYANKLKAGEDCKTWVSHSSFHDQMIHCKKSCNVCPHSFVVDEVANKKAMKTDLYINANAKSGSDVVRRCAKLKFRVVRPSGRASAGESLIEHISDDDGDDADRDTDDGGLDLEAEAHDLEDSMDQGSDDEKESDHENADDGENENDDDDDDDGDDDDDEDDDAKPVSLARSLLKNASKDSFERAEAVASTTWTKKEPQPFKDVKCNADQKSSADACNKRLKELKGKRDVISKKCQLPSGAPYYAVAPHLFCAGSPGGKHGCKKYNALMKKCFKELKPLDLEAASCEACVALGANFPSLFASGGTPPQQPPPTHEQEMEMRKRQDTKDAALKEQQAKELESIRQFYLAAEKELHNGGLPVDPSLFTATENEEDLEDSSSTAIPWPQKTTVRFEVLYQKIDTDDGKATKKELKTAWKKTAVKTKDCSGMDCTYAVEIPCNAAVGAGTLVGRAAISFNLPLRVVFNPLVPGDEAYMSPKNFTKDALHTYLFQTTGGVWWGSSAGFQPMKWNFDQFSPEVLDTTMKLLTMVPVEQRGQAPRVFRWFTNLIPDHVLWGNWCTEPKCMADAVKKPGGWSSSKDIFSYYLKTGMSVKYGQCWVFAAITTSIGRALGVGIRVMTNFDSAHGIPPYNKGIDDFFYYDAKMVLKKMKSNSQESKWNFHVWNDVWMKRNDLKTVKDADGWQAIDATPQESSCELENGKKVCRTMMGPAPLNVIKSLKFETKGGEAGWGHTGGGVSYDSYFVFGESNGEFRGWKPAFEAWHKCPKTCQAEWPGDGACDDACNVKECDFDMGDCCEKDCKKHVKGVPLYKKFKCGKDGYTCKGSAKGWGEKYNDRTHIGRYMSTQAPGKRWQKRLDVTLVNYKKKQ